MYVYICMYLCVYIMVRVYLKRDGMQPVELANFPRVVFAFIEPSQLTQVKNREIQTVFDAFARFIGL